MADTATDVVVTPILEGVIGDTGKFTVSVEPNTAPQGVSYSSSNNAIITVDSEGNWELKGVGNAIVTVTSDDQNSVTATITVTVTEPTVPDEGDGEGDSSPSTTDPRALPGKDPFLVWVTLEKAMWRIRLALGGAFSKLFK